MATGKQEVKFYREIKNCREKGFSREKIVQIFAKKSFSTMLLLIDIFRIVAQFDPCASITYARTSKATFPWIAYCHKTTLDDLSNAISCPCSKAWEIRFLKIIGTYPWTNIPISYNEKQHRLEFRIDGYCVPIYLEVYGRKNPPLLRIKHQFFEVSLCKGPIHSLEPILQTCLKYAKMQRMQRAHKKARR